MFINNKWELNFFDSLFNELSKINNEHNIANLIYEISNLYLYDSRDFPYNLLLTYYLLKYTTTLFFKDRDDLFNKFKNLERSLHIKKEKRTLNSEENILYNILLEHNEYIDSYVYDIKKFDKTPNIYIILTLLILLDVFKSNNEKLSETDQNNFIDFLLSLLTLLPNYDKNKQQIRGLFIKLFINIDFNKLNECDKLKEFRQFYIRTFQKRLTDRLTERMEQGIREQDELDRLKGGRKPIIKKVVRKY